MADSQRTQGIIVAMVKTPYSCGAACVALLAIAAIARATHNFVVVEGVPPSAITIEARSKMDDTELAAGLLKAGYVGVNVAGTTICFSELVWQQKAMDRLLRLYKELVNSSQVGVVSYGTGPDLLAAAQDLASRFGYDVDQSASGQLNVNRSYTCELNGKVVQLSGSTKQPPYDPSRALRPID